MKHIGVIFAAYGCAEYVEKALAPWIEFKGRGCLSDWPRPEVSICAVSVPFENFDAEDDGTGKFLKESLVNYNIFHLVKSDIPLKETTARQQAAKILMENGATELWQVDGDEFYTVEEIEKIVKFVRERPLITTFRLSLKNFIWDEQHYLAVPFCPMRIHRVKFNEFSVGKFWDDNNIEYTDGNSEIKDIQLSSLTVPKAIAWVKHLTWLNNDRSRKKIEYQKKRWPVCSFQWNEATKAVEFNPEYYKKNQLALPEVLKL